MATRGGQSLEGETLSESEPRLPGTIGPYAVDALLGTGGMGRVYLASDDRGRKVAVKIMHEHIADDPSSRERVVCEMALAQRVRSTGTAQVIEADVDAERPWIAIEYLDGPTLAEVGDLNDAELRRIAAELLDALTALHAAGIVHRDLKPANVILTTTGPKVIDFGIAVDTAETRMTATGMMVATPAYAAPEQLSSSDIGPATDVWAWAAIMTTIASSVPPFGDDSLISVARRVLEEPPNLAGVPDWLRPACSAALNKTAHDRPTTAELLAMLEPDVAPTPDTLTGGQPGPAQGPHFPAPVPPPPAPAPASAESSSAVLPSSGSPSAGSPSAPPPPLPAPSSRGPAQSPALASNIAEPPMPASPGSSASAEPWGPVTGANVPEFSGTVEPAAAPPTGNVGGPMAASSASTSTSPSPTNTDQFANVGSVNQQWPGTPTPGPDQQAGVPATPASSGNRVLLATGVAVASLILIVGGFFAWQALSDDGDDPNGREVATDDDRQDREPSGEDDATSDDGEDDDSAADDVADDDADSDSADSDDAGSVPGADNGDGSVPDDDADSDDADSEDRESEDGDSDEGRGEVPPLDGPNGGGGPLVFGGLLPQTGALAFLGPPMLAGVELAIEDVNASGGVGGSDVTYVPGDSGADFVVALATINGHIGADADVLVGPASSSLSAELLEFVKSTNRVLFSPSATSRELTTADDDGLFFRTSPTDRIQGAALGELIRSDGAESAFFLALDNSYATGLSDDAQERFTDRGGVVAGTRRYDGGSDNYDVEIAAVVDADPDAIVIVGFEESATILRGLIEVGIGPENKMVYGVDANFTDLLAAEFSDPSVLEGMRGTLPGVDVAGQLPEFAARLDRTDAAQAAGGLSDYSYSAETYDVIVVSSLAAIMTDSDDPSDIAAQINEVTGGGEKCTAFAECARLLQAGLDIDYDGLSGPLEFTDAGEPSEASILIVEFDSRGRRFVAESRLTRG